MPQRTFHKQTALLLKSSKHKASNAISFHKLFSAISRSLRNTKFEYIKRESNSNDISADTFLFFKANLFRMLHILFLTLQRSNLKVFYTGTGNKPITFNYYVCHKYGDFEHGDGSIGESQKPIALVKYINSL